MEIIASDILQVMQHCKLSYEEVMRLSVGEFQRLLEEAQKGIIDMGGPPNPGTKKDMRKKSNNPQAGKKPAAQTKVTKAVTPVKKAK